MELAIVSGKGGTGKTTIATAICELINEVNKVDADVDAPNFYLFEEETKSDNVFSKNFYGEQKPEVDMSVCIQCNKCGDVCRFDAINNGIVNDVKCESCGACAIVCPVNAIQMKPVKGAEEYITRIKKGYISNAEMEIGAEGSGKLITELRANMRDFKDKKKITVIDGSPGIGCPVIASLTGVDIALVVVESTISGFEDLKRVNKLIKQFDIFTLLCINKYDINEKISIKIEEYCKNENIQLVGKIPYDDIVMKSINEFRPITEYEGSVANEAIRIMWNNIKNLLK